MRMARFFLIPVFFLFLLSSSIPAAYAGAPTDQVRQTVDKVIDILKNKELKKPENEKKRRVEIRKVVSERFDFEEMAKRALALHWKKRTPEERKEFVQLFTDLLEKAYIRKIEKYTDEKVLYPGEKMQGDYGVVDTRVVSKQGVETPIQYRVLKENGTWMVYDVVIEGVSLVNNYRNQFNRIVRENSYEELVRKLKSKEAEDLIKEKK
jgi:phospholipid transport system substrate-binding protein